MTLSAGDLEAGRRYLFTVTVSKKSQGASRFASTNVTVIALAGDPPRVSLGPTLLPPLAQSLTHLSSSR